MAGDGHNVLRSRGAMEHSAPAAMEPNSHHGVSRSNGRDVLTSQHDVHKLNHSRNGHDALTDLLPESALPVPRRPRPCLHDDTDVKPLSSFVPKPQSGHGPGSNGSLSDSHDLPFQSNHMLRRTPNTSFNSDRHAKLNGQSKGSAGAYPMPSNAAAKVGLSRAVAPNNSILESAAPGGGSSLMWEPRAPKVRSQLATRPVPEENTGA